MEEHQIVKWGSDSLYRLMQHTHPGRMRDAVSKFDFTGFKDITDKLSTIPSSYFHDTDKKINIAKESLCEIESRGLIVKKSMLDSRLHALQKAREKIAEAIVEVFGIGFTKHQIIDDVDAEIDKCSKSIAEISEESMSDCVKIQSLKTQIERLNKANEHRRIVGIISGNGTCVDKKLLKLARDTIRFFEEINDSSNVDCRQMKIEGRCIREMIKQMKQAN